MLSRHFLSLYFVLLFFLKIRISSPVPRIWSLQSNSSLSPIPGLKAFFPLVSVFLLLHINLCPHQPFSPPVNRPAQVRAMRAMRVAGGAEGADAWPHLGGGAGGAPARRLTEEARRSGSHDDVTVVVVVFEPT
jgi:hypothetical protein